MGVEVETISPGDGKLFLSACVSFNAAGGGGGYGVPYFPRNVVQILLNV